MLKIVERFEDMSQQGRLRLLKQADGDIIVCILADPEGPDKGASLDVEFCLSGGKSDKTLVALNQLMVAMKEDNLDRPYCSRRGKCGLGGTDLLIAFKDA
jgi:hypothetical protein